jgi:hypothetical protein
LSAKRRCDRADCRMWRPFVFGHIEHAANLKAAGRRWARRGLGEFSEHGRKVLLTP